MSDRIAWAGLTNVDAFDSAESPEPRDEPDEFEPREWFAEESENGGTSPASPADGGSAEPPADETREFSRRRIVSGA